MISELLQLYENKIVTGRDEVPSPEKYAWFMADEQTIGIEKTALSKKERDLLYLFLTPVTSRGPLSAEQIFWYELLIEGKETKECPEPFRLIHFYIKDASVDQDSFSEAVDGLYPQGPVILWENKNEGILIEQHRRNEDETSSYEALADTLTTDFYTDVFLYIGRTNEDPSAASNQFESEKNAFTICRHTLKENVFYHHEQIPYLLLHHSEENARKQLVRDLLKNVEEDKELLKSIQYYLESNMNVTTAAKQLFIHRNSLQYRVDKFAEKTNLDVKTFKEAVTVYLALLDKRL